MNDDADWTDAAQRYANTRPRLPLEPPPMRPYGEDASYALDGIYRLMQGMHDDHTLRCLGIACEILNKVRLGNVSLPCLALALLL